MIIVSYPARHGQQKEKKLKFEELVKYIEEMPVILPYDGTAKELKIFIDGFESCQKRILEHLKSLLKPQKE